MINTNKTLLKPIDMPIHEKKYRENSVYNLNAQWELNFCNAYSLRNLDIFTNTYFLPTNVIKTFIFSIYFKDYNYIVTLLDNGLKLEANGDYY